LIIGTKSLRYALLTMEPCMSLDVCMSTHVHGGGHCDGVVDVGCGCQAGDAPRSVVEGSTKRAHPYFHPS
jgi:hypothetical protein